MWAAMEHGISEQALKDFLVQQMTKHLEEGVSAGRITADKAEKMKANMDEHITNMINGKRPMHDGKKMMGRENADNQETENQ
jgi:hypothetical protein